MKIKLFLTSFLLIIVQQDMIGQINAVDDTFYFRNDTALDYRLRVRFNDSSSFPFRIFGFQNKQGTGSYTLSTSDTIYSQANALDINYIIIRDTSANTSYSGSFTYLVQDSLGNTDSARVFFFKIPMNKEVYPGEVISDSTVNHFDLFGIGLFYNQYGSSRHLLDNNIDFSPKAVGNWSFSIGNMNGKYADVDGDGVVSIRDVDGLRQNFGEKTGTYKPKLSDTTGTHRLYANIADTILLDTIQGRLSIPIAVDISPALQTYGLGYTAQVVHNATAGQNPTPLKSYSIASSNVPWADKAPYISMEDTLSQINARNFVLCRTNRFNGNMDREPSVVEIVVEEILIGIANPSQIVTLQLNLKDVALIDNQFQFIPIKPLAKTIYLKRSHSSAQSTSLPTVLVYPTLVGHHLTIYRAGAKPVAYSIYNTLGQVVGHGILHQTTNDLDNISWQSGIYYLKIDGCSDTIRLQKN